MQNTLSKTHTLVTTYISFITRVLSLHEFKTRVYMSKRQMQAFTQEKKRFEGNVANQVLYQRSHDIRGGKSNGWHHGASYILAHFTFMNKFKDDNIYSFLLPYRFL